METAKDTANTSQNQKMDTSVWNMDTTHSHINFVARHMVIANVKGTFEKVEGKVFLPGNDIEAARAEVTVDISSISTGVTDRDNHLKSPDFFDVANYDKAYFKTTDITKTGEGEFDVTGDLTIRNITKPITLKATHGGTIKDPYGLQRMGFEVSGKINRFDFDLKWNALLEAGGAVVGPDIKIQADVEFTKQQG